MTMATIQANPDPLQSSTSASLLANTWLDKFASSIYQNDAPRLVNDCFLPYGWFRDVLVFSWNLRSLEGITKIEKYLTTTITNNSDNSNRNTNQNETPLKLANVTNITLVSGSDDNQKYHNPRFIPKTESGGSSGLELCFKFETRVGYGSGRAQLVAEGQPESQEFKALTVTMILEEIRGHEEMGYESGVYGEHTLAWGDVLAERKAKIEKDPYVLIVGAGQTGLQVAARFKQMNIASLLIEKNDRVGDTWRKRYPTMTLHTMKRHHELLYQPYPSNWPFYTPRDKLADWLESYAVFQDLTVWTKSALKQRPIYDSDTKKWTVTVSRRIQNPGGEEVEINVQIQPAHIVLATGTLGKMFKPTLEDESKFQGIIIHGSEYQGGKEFVDKKVIVVGAGNTSIDICQDLCHHKASSVTMVQRSSTCVVTGDNVTKHMSETWVDGFPVGVGDFKFATTPLGFQRRMAINDQQAMWDEEKELHEKLRKGGIKLNMGPDGSGQFILVFSRCGGYWLDKGGADLIGSGEIKVKQGIQPVKFTENALVFQDGSKLEADVVIFATGYQNIREVNKELFGEEVIDKTSLVYGVDEEYELNGSYRPSGYPGLWFASGDFFHSRFMSKHLALQIKAVELGLI
ncbi:hypothetical protein ABKN59_010876 [Abortiporus biennis]